MNIFVSKFLIDSSYYIIKNSSRLTLSIINKLYNYYYGIKNDTDNNEEIKLLKLEIVNIIKDIENIKKNNKYLN